MLKQYKTKDQKGFTIIEVLIVLAIAGLILLIVFLAVPALQRNSRNTQRKTDVGRIGGAATTVVSNNQGKIDTTGFTTANVQNEVGDTMSYYQQANVSASVLAASGSLTNATTIDTVVVVGNAKCSGANAAYSNRQVAVLYSSESGGGTATHLCIDQ
jgi:prepilin-type N-terminal cleavage/methylation domain-containing protein